MDIDYLKKKNVELKERMEKIDKAKDKVWKEKDVLENQIRHLFKMPQELKEYDDVYNYWSSIDKEVRIAFRSLLNSASTIAKISVREDDGFSTEWYITRTYGLKRPKEWRGIDLLDVIYKRQGIKDKIVWKPSFKSLGLITIPNPEQGSSFGYGVLPKRSVEIDMRSLINDGRINQKRFKEFFGMLPALFGVKMKYFNSDLYSHSNTWSDYKAPMLDIHPRILDELEKNKRSFDISVEKAREVGNQVCKMLEKLREFNKPFKVVQALKK